MRIIILLLSTLSVLSCAIYAQDAQKSSNELDALIRKVVGNHPSLEVARAKLDMLKARIPQASAWPDPVLTVGANNYPAALNPVNISRFPMTSTRIGITQKLPNSGTLSLSELAAKQDWEIAATDLDQAGLQLSHETRQLYTRIGYLNKRTARLQQLLNVLHSIKDITEAKFESGLIPLAAVLRVENRIDEMQERILQLEQGRKTAVASLYWLTGDDQLHEQITFTHLPTWRPRTEKELVDAALANSPEFNRQRRSISRSHTLVELAEKEAGIDISVNASYGYRWDMTDLWTANVAITLPLHRGSRERMKVAERQSQARMNELSIQVMEQRLRSRINAITAEAALLQERHTYLAATALPNVKTTREALRSQFEADQVSVTELLDLHSREIALQLQVITIQESLSLLAVELQTLTGSLYTTREE